MAAKGILPLVLVMTPWAGVAQNQAAALAPGELVWKTVANELAAANVPGHYMYRLRKVTPQGAQTRDQIETRTWLIGRLVQINGKPLSRERQEEEDKRLRNLLTDTKRLQAFQEKEHHDEQRVRRMMKALPDAFLYEYAGPQKDACCGALVQLKFRPNPKFDPPSRELRVLQGMEGTMQVDPRADRLVRVEARLVRDVDFGWGLLGRLYRGGSFLLEQRDVGNGRWAITELRLHFTGKILLVKSLNIDSVTQASDFRRMPDTLTLEEGLEALLARDKMTVVGPATRNKR